MAVILIVDDDPTVRVVATELLRSSEHNIVEATDGDEALRLLHHLPVDLVVLDMLMPNKDGLEVLTAIRKSRSRLPILAITGGGSMDAPLLLRCAAAFGADGVMQKPLRKGQFEEAVAGLLRAGEKTASLKIA